MGRSFTVSLAASVCVGSLCPAPALADDLVLAPASDWKLSELEDKCRVSRTFGEGEDRTTLWLDQGSLKPAYNLTLIGRPLRNPFGAALSVQFAPQAEYSRAYLKAESSKGRPVISMFGARVLPTLAEIDPDRDMAQAKSIDDTEDEWVDVTSASDGEINDPVPTPEQIAAITHLRFARAVVKPLVLETGSLTAPFADLQACAERLEDRWEVANRAAGGTPARPKDQGRWAAIISNNYPMHMLRAEQEGSIGVLLTIGKNGRPSDCEVTRVIGPTGFNDTVCLLMMQHATFEPARNAAGEPVPGRFSTRVTFRLN